MIEDAHFWQQVAQLLAQYLARKIDGNPQRLLEVAKNEIREKQGNL